MGLEHYWQKRDFRKTAEPRGRVKQRSGYSFVVQKHAARRLHYDFRLELDGVLLSWAIPKGPSLDPGVKRLAVQTEDHPIEYGAFEGVIPKGEYGGGAVVVWDRGTWKPDGDPHEMYRKGRLTFELEGEKLRGAFHLVKTGGSGGKAGKAQWLLIKRNDAAAKRGSDTAVVDDRPNSVVTGRTVEDVAKDPDGVWSGKRGALVPRGSQKRPRDRAKVEGAERAAPPPDFVEPQLATLVDTAPEGEEWLHELKLDGYRIVARVDRGTVTLKSRRGNDWTSRLPTIASAVARLPLASAILDGEVVVLGNEGVSDFQLLQNSMEAGKDGACVYFLFDAPFLDGHDLRELPLLKRKELLSERLAGLEPAGGPVRLSDHVVGNGGVFFDGACQIGLEGIVSKRVDGPYVSGRTRSWLKVKCSERQEFVIGGFTDPRKTRGHFGALLLGVRDRDKLLYAGKVGTGFTSESLREIKKRLTKLERKTPPFDDPPRGAEAKGVHWLAPKLVAEVEFAERTHDGKVRHASFRGLRDDKTPAEVVPETPEPAPAKPDEQRKARQSTRAAVAEPTLDASRVRITHPDRVLYPEQGITKRDLALYYAKVSSWMLPHVAGRPLMILRCPEGTSKTCFHQKHASKGMPRAVATVDVESGPKAEPHLMIEDVEGLIGLVQMGALEIHTWGCTRDAIECPERLVFDLDPDEGLPWRRVAEAARSLRGDLEEAGLTAFLKTTGGKGLHLVVPVEPVTPWEEAKAFCKALVQKRVKAEPSKYLAVMTKEKRKGKIFLDYLRNGRGSTAVCTFSTRARAGAPVSAPLGWHELDDDERPVFDVKTLPERLASLPEDPWEEFEAARAPIPNP